MASDETALSAGLAPAATPGGEAVTARRYHHPLLGSRPVVRLSGQAAAPADDRIMAVDGFSAPDAGDPVAARYRTEPGYPEWALVNDPANTKAALAAAPEMERAARLAAPKPGPALDICQEVADTLPDNHLPAFWEQAGRAFIAAGRTKQGSLMFGRARAAEKHAAGTDPVRRRAVFLEFALAGALSAKDIKNYVAELGKEPDPVAAYRELRELAVRRTLGGLPPWKDMLKQLAKLAKAAGLDVADEQASVLEELLEAPALWRAADGFWTSQRKELLAALSRSAAARRRLVWQLVELPVSDMDGWLTSLLDETGAVDELGERTGAWLVAMLRRYSGGDRRPPEAPQYLLDLVPRLAPRIRTDEGPLRLGSGTGRWHRIDAAVVGACLAAGIPVADPDPHLLMGHWRQHGRVDLDALTADDRFADRLTASIMEDINGRWNQEWTVEPLQPSLRYLTDAWLRGAGEFSLKSALNCLHWLHTTLSRRAVEHVPDLVPRLAGIDLVAPLTRTLRAGIFDELGWNALDEVAPELGDDNWCRASWPVLTVHDRAKAVAIGHSDRILEHRLHVPKGADRFNYGVWAFYSAGEFQVGHEVNGTLTQYWSGDPGEKTTKDGDGWRERHAIARGSTTGYTFLDPQERRFTGGRPLAAGEWRLSGDGHMFHDGAAFWVRTDDGRVRRYDPKAGEPGGAELPWFLDPSLLGGDEHWLIESSSLAPAVPGTESSPLGSDGAHLGFRAARDRRTGKVRYHRIDGVHGTVPPGEEGEAWGLLDVPAAQGRLLLEGDYFVTARDPDTGDKHWTVYMMDREWIVNEPSAMAAGTPRMPPKAFWHFLTPRDLPGSRALRRISEDTVRSLLAVAAPRSAAALRTAVAKLLPEITHPRLVEGVVGVVTEAAARLRDRDRLIRVLGGVPHKRLEVAEADLEAALSGLVSHYPEGDGGLVRQIELAAGFFGGSVDAETAAAHWGNHASDYDWTELAGRIGGLAVRAAGALTPDAQRAALAALLRFWASSPLNDPALQRGLLDEESPQAVSTGEGALLPLDIPVHFGDWARSHDEDNHTTKAFLQRGDVPRPVGFVDARPVPRGWGSADRLRLLAHNLERREPVPFDREAATRLARDAGLDYAAAALLLAGLPGVPDPGWGVGEPSAQVRDALGITAAEVAKALGFWRERSCAARLELYDAAMPESPNELWDRQAMAGHLAQACRERGIRM
ncbi:hypothetical protein FZ103_17935 [Streptomonospora sp. PA3]|uniref:hypothetical protein n=1 Tax=Streptomonospora sp. PA3 TaxID=2607326 RepID=UPI0012DE76A6|nr:hypothetical protein [Streptomonospora sp. PA3]MUL43028.1 hypothetical protein [Streptomonospora sp. PA3]